MNALVAWARRPVPLTLATTVFCFLEGAALSVPVALLLVPVRPFLVPDSLSERVAQIAFFAVCALPLWSLLCWRKHRRLAKSGLITLLAIVVLGFLFPAL